MQKVVIPGDVPSSKRELFRKNMLTLTKNTKNIFMFAGDQHVEHLNDDFYGSSPIGMIPKDHSHPNHLFSIAQGQHAGAFAAQYGLMSRYGPQFPNIPYIVKVNSKTNLVPTKQRDPFSGQLVAVDDILRLKKNSRLNIIGIGYTIYIGSEYESDMLTEASQLITDAHNAGLLATLWMYPRGKAVKNERDVHLIAGAAGAATCLGADVIKVNYPGIGPKAAEIFQEVTRAAGNSKVLCAGGSAKDSAETFFKRLYEQIHIAGCAGTAIGRNIHQHSLKDALRFSKAVAAITYQNKGVKTALRIWNKK